MGKIIAGISMSLDGYINDPQGSVDPLYPDFAEMHDVPSFKETIEHTGAVIMGKHAYEMAEPESWANDDYEFQTPIFVLSHTIPDSYPKGNGKLSFSFVTDGIASAIAQAKAAAHGKDVQIIGGASTIQQALNSGLCDEFHLDIIPVILGGGLKLFDGIDVDKVKLERLSVEAATSARTSLKLNILK